METLKFKLTPDIIKAAHDFEKFRSECKRYLKEVGKSYDKFTMVEHDSFIAYITEVAIRQYIHEKYSSKNIEVISWNDNFDIEAIQNILSHNSKEEEDIKLLVRYFYDKYDIQLKRVDKSLYIDVKTALTKKEPKGNWNFMYPVVQASKLGKDYLILTYYVVEDVSKIESMNKIVLVGYISENLIKKCKIIKKGTKTRFGTMSQIDNYETELSVHYKDIDLLIKKLIEET